MSKKIPRPGGQLASRPLNFFWVVDCSGSMYGEKIGKLNRAIQDVLPEMKDAAYDNPNAQLLIRTLKFSTGASWLTDKPIDVNDYVWEDLEAGGVTDLGMAFDLLAAQFELSQIGERALPPVVVLISDGQPTDNYKKSLDKFMQLPWAKKAVRIAVAIYPDADEDVLYEFTKNKELILKAKNATLLAKMIKWASTAVSAVSTGASNTVDDNTNNLNDPSSDNNEQYILDMDNIPDVDDIDNDDIW